MPRFLSRLLNKFRAPDTDSYAYDRRTARLIQRREDIEKDFIDDLRQLDEIYDQLRQRSRRGQGE